jgi:hypothetical protein
METIKDFLDNGHKGHNVLKMCKRWLKTIYRIITMVHNG